MKTSRAIIYISLPTAIVSLLLYVSDLPSLVLSADKMNAVLLALFGAAVPSFVTSTISYKHEIDCVEEDLFVQLESIISAFAGLKECVVENFDTNGEENCCKLIVEYYKEKEINNLSGNAFPKSTKARDKLVQSIENCNQEDCARFSEDKDSSFGRYISRFENSLNASVDSYLNLDRKLKEKYEKSFKIDVEKAAYLFPFFRRGKYLNEIIELTDEYKNSLNETIEQCRLRQNGEALTSELITEIKKAEEQWLKNEKLNWNNEHYSSNNCYALNLYIQVGKFAKLSSLPQAAKFNGAPWW